MLNGRQAMMRLEQVLVGAVKTGVLRTARRGGRGGVGGGACGAGVVVFVFLFFIIGQ